MNLNLQQVLQEISNSGTQEIKVNHLKTKAGNRDGKGDYKVISLEIGANVINFNNKNGSWSPGN